MTAAYDALDDALDDATKARIAPLEAVYTFEQLDATLRAQDSSRAPLTPEIIAERRLHRFGEQSSATSQGRGSRAHAP